MDRQELGKFLLELVEQETGEKPGHVDDATELRGGLHLDSLDMVSMVLEIENRLKIEVSTEELAEAVTVGQLLDVLQKKVDAGVARRAA